MNMILNPLATRLGNVSSFSRVSVSGLAVHGPGSIVRHNRWHLPVISRFISTYRFDTSRSVLSLALSLVVQPNVTLHQVLNHLHSLYPSVISVLDAVYIVRASNLDLNDKHTILDTLGIDVDLLYSLPNDPGLIPYVSNVPFAHPHSQDPPVYNNSVYWAWWPHRGYCVVFLQQEHRLNSFVQVFLMMREPVSLQDIHTKQIIV